MEIGNIIVWKSNKDLIEIVENSFKGRILLKEQKHIVGLDRKNLIDELYYPILPDKSDERYCQTQDITIFLVNLNPSSKFIWRTEGYRLCNLELLEFKLNHRRNFSHLEFHCSDNITECNKSIQLFNLDYTTNLEIIDVDNLYHFIHGFAETNDECYSLRKFNIVPISESPVVKYLQGYKDIYLSQSKIFMPRENTIIHHFNNYNSEKIVSEIKVVKVSDKYVVCDGMHRSSVLYFYGNRKILVKIVDDISEPNDARFYPYISNIDFPVEIKKSHWDSLYRLIFELNNQQIKWIIVRGFRKMPNTADTDLDIVIHPSDYDKFSKIISEFVKLGYFRINHINSEYLHPNKKLYYSAYSTIGNDGDYISNNCFQLDIYNNLFFFDKNNGMCLTDGFIDELLKYKLVKNNLVIPHIHFELVILLYRIYIDKKGIWTIKHKNIMNSIVQDPNFNSVDFTKLLHYAMKFADVKIPTNINEYL
jgi:hypothetical protein